MDTFSGFPSWYLFFLNQKFLFCLPSAIFILLPLSPMHTLYFKYLIDAEDCAMFKNNFISSYVFHIVQCVKSILKTTLQFTKA